jgi:hypothetical protein
MAASGPRRTETELSEQDREVLHALAQAGSNLAMAHPLRHYLYFADKRAARKVGEALRDEGYSVDVRRGAEGKDWLVLAKHTAVPSPELVARLTARMEALATTAHGAYDGWEARVVT